jgi:cold shock CspA family protein
MPIGTVKKLLIDKHCGFIMPVAGGADVFFHGSTLMGSEFSMLAAGQRVEFDVDEESLADDRGLRASRVRVLHGSPPVAVGQGEFRQLRRHPAARAKKPTWRKKSG